MGLADMKLFQFFYSSLEPDSLGGTSYLRKRATTAFGESVVAASSPLVYIYVAVLIVWLTPNTLCADGELRLMGELS